MKDEGRLPTGSFKARGLAMAVTMAKQFGVERIAMPTNGNAGAALAAYGARAGSKRSSSARQKPPRSMLPRPQHMARASSCGWPDRRVRCARREGRCARAVVRLLDLKEPYRLEGKKVMGFELIEQLGWDAPDAIFTRRAAEPV